ncbi:MAG: aldehyde dehydrogenase [Bacteroidia bacterium]|nr:aldehyde dehydrogenase [Bacteroidia bacterium]
MPSVDTAVAPIELAPMRAFFHQGVTREKKIRLRYLKRLEDNIRRFESEINNALQQDLGKPVFEGYAAEIGFVLEELRHAILHLDKWMQPRSVPTALAQLPGQAYVRYEPRGVVLIISPWNYPFQLMIAPLVGAIAAGNVCVLKPSEFAPATAAIIEKLVKETFPPEYVQVVQGDAKVAEALMEEDWDYIFFTGSTRVGRKVAEAAARRLIPYTLELGGKSPAIVEPDANLDVAARRIAWGKWLNAGQTCIAPDYLFVHESILRPFLEKLRETIEDFYGNIQHPLAEYARIIHRGHYDRLVQMMQEGTIVYGGYTDPDKLYISPTILTSPKGSLLEEEIFGPLLPVLSYGSPEEVVQQVRRLPPPLGLYVFTGRKAQQAYYLEHIPSGGACINDTLMQVGSPYLPFGGLRHSGIGRYHGWYSFETFSHARGVVETPTWIDLPLRYPPYKKKLSLIRWILG